MRNLMLLCLLTTSLFACKTGWSVQDQQSYKQNCMQMAQGVTNAEEICDCGLQKAMENFDSKEKAEKAIQNMTENELQDMFAGCM